MLDSALLYYHQSINGGNILRKNGILQSITVPETWGIKAVLEAWGLWWPNSLLIQLVFPLTYTILHVFPPRSQLQVYHDLDHDKAIIEGEWINEFTFLLQSHMGIFSVSMLKLQILYTLKSISNTYLSSVWPKCCSTIIYHKLNIRIPVSASITASQRRIGLSFSLLDWSLVSQTISVSCHVKSVRVPYHGHLPHYWSTSSHL